MVNVSLNDVQTPEYAPIRGCLPAGLDRDDVSPLGSSFPRMVSYLSARTVGTDLGIQPWLLFELILIINRTPDLSCNVVLPRHEPGLHTGQATSLETTGGTSDGRFIAPTGAQVLELGPVNESIHKINEHVNVEELEQLSQIYQSILENLLT